MRPRLAPDLCGGETGTEREVGEDGNCGSAVSCLTAAN